MKMGKLLFAVFLGLLAVVHSTPVDTVTHSPTANEDVFREAMTDGFLIPSLTTDTPKMQSTIESSSTAADVSGDSVLPSESPDTNTSLLASRLLKPEDFEGSTSGLDDTPDVHPFWNHGETTTTSTQTPEASSDTESMTTAAEFTTSSPVSMTNSAGSMTTAAEFTTSSPVSMTNSAGSMTTAAEFTTSSPVSMTNSAGSMNTAAEPMASASESMTSGFDPNELLAESSTIQESLQPFSEYVMEGSASGQGEDSPTSTPEPEPADGDETVMRSGRIHSLGSDIGIIEDPPLPIETSEMLNSPKPDPEQHNGHSTPGWIIIVGFIVGVAALVLLCLAIATRDKWNGPNQASTTKTESNPSNQQRELEMETFLHREEPKENGKAAEYTVIPLDELSESYS